VYGYNSDGARVWKRGVLARQEYRYICRIGCGGVLMRVYIREFADTGWLSLARRYSGYQGNGGDKSI